MALEEFLYLYFFNIFNYILICVLIPVIILQRRDPVASVLWIVIIILAPYLGALAYIFFGRTRVKRKSRKKRKSDAII